MRMYCLSFRLRERYGQVEKEEVKGGEEDNEVVDKV